MQIIEEHFSTTFLYTFDKRIGGVNSSFEFKYLLQSFHLYCVLELFHTLYQIYDIHFETPMSSAKHKSNLLAPTVIVCYYRRNQTLL